MKWRRWASIICLVLLAASVAFGAADDTGWFREAAGPPEPDLKTKRRLPGGKTLSLDFVGFKPIAGLSEAAIPYLCGVVPRREASESQALLTVGTGRTRFWTCDGLSEQGVVRTKNDGWVIALSYNAVTPSRISTATVVLVPDPSGRFHIDETLVGRANLAPLDDLRRVVARMTP